MWIPSKLTCPKRLHNTIARPRVLELLQQAKHYKLVLFRSPAGYGKTTMVASWLQDKPHTAWYNLDESDNDPYRFINYFIQVINKATSQSCAHTQTMAERRQFSSLTALLSEVLSELAHFKDKAYLVLDDYHLITEESIHSALRFFIKYLPDNLTIVMTSRTIPPLNTANLRVRDVMLEIDNQFLAFDSEETTRFFNQRIAEVIDNTIAQDVCNYVEGWPSALQLIALQTQQHKRTLAQTMQSMLSFNHSHLWDYLIEEVFEQLDSQTQHFLMQCSVLTHFNDHLARELTQRDDALSVLESLNRLGLFLYTQTHNQNWYRFHHLFAEFLTHQRQSFMPSQEADLHRKAAQAWLANNTPHQALRHAHLAQDTELLALILNTHGWKMFNQGELEILESAIAQLHDHELHRQPKLCLLQAWLAQSQHRYQDVSSLLERSLAGMQQLNVTPTLQEQGEFNALRAQVAINQNEPHQALQLAELALSQLDNTVYRSRIVATSVVGEVHHVLGHLRRALSMMQQTEKLSRQYQVYQQALWALLQQSELLMAQGFIQAAFEVQENAFKLVEEQRLHQVPLYEFLLRIRAQIYWCWNRLEEADSCAYKGLEVLGKQNENQHLHSYALLARSAIGRGELDKASRFIEKILHLQQQTHYHLDWTANASFALTLYYQVKEDQTAMQAWLDHAEQPTVANNHFTQLQWRNIARAQLYLQHYEAANTTLAFLQQQAEEYALVTDRNRNLVLESHLALATANPNRAELCLKEALNLASQTGMISYFLLEGTQIYPILERLLQTHSLDDLARYRAQQLLKEIAQTQRGRSLHFDEYFVEKLINHTNLPELIRTSPLTQREWQVLGLIYSGFSNEQIAQELDVAGTTIKTHIRNLYQKLNIANRKEAINTAENLLKLMGH